MHGVADARFGGDRTCAALRHRRSSRGCSKKRPSSASAVVSNVDRWGRGNVGAMTFAADEPNPMFLRIAEQYEHALQLIATCFHRHAPRKLSGTRTVDGVSLTPRESSACSGLRTASPPGISPASWAPSRAPPLSTWTMPRTSSACARSPGQPCDYAWASRRQIWNPLTTPFLPA